MIKSSLCSVVIESPNKNSPRNHVIDTITIHHMAGNLSVESCGNMFANPSRGGSSNYGVGSDGRIACYVGEEDRSWCSSSSSNDNRAITIEVANDGGSDTNWHVSDAAYNSLIALLVDICNRNNIKKLLWSNDKSLIGQVDKQNMTIHRWFTPTTCPGEYLLSLHSKIADDVNKKLGNGMNSTFYRVQVGAYYIKDNADRMYNKLTSEGFDAIIVSVMRGNRILYRVQVGAYNIKDNAINMYNKLKSLGYDAIIVEVNNG